MASFPKRFLPIVLPVLLLATGGAYWLYLPQEEKVSLLSGALPGRNGTVLSGQPGPLPAVLSPAVPPSASPERDVPHSPPERPHSSSDPALDPPGSPPLADAPSPLRTEEEPAVPAPAGEEAVPVSAGEESAPAAPAPAGEDPAPAPVAADAALPVSGDSPAAVFNQGRSVASGTVQGEIPDPRAVVDTRRIFGDLPEGAAGQGVPKGEDGLIGIAFIHDLAAFLVENYWPAGTHPLAGSRGISTADLKWANNKYGVQLEGFRVNSANPDSERKRILRHVLSPSMVKGLYALYRDRFLEALAREAATRRRGLGGTERVLTPAEISGMFRFYAGQARGLAGAMRAYFSREDMAARVAACAGAAEKAAAARLRYQESLSANPASLSASAREYQQAVIRRDQERANLAAALRRGGNTRGLDAESLVFVAMWLYRRAPEDAPALRGLIAILEDLAGRLETAGAASPTAPPSRSP
ncbi:MAG: hypothetical protein LBP61_04935 [Desulfovibrio sp.]|jgi:hypothetical protein|nr:hypothetical protein [Desulfovibrio sp.]